MLAGVKKALKPNDLKNNEEKSVLVEDQGQAGGNKTEKVGLF